MVSNKSPVQDFAIEQLIRPDVGDSTEIQAVVFFSWRLENDDKSRVGTCVYSHNLTTGNCFVSPSAYQSSEEFGESDWDDEEVYYDLDLSLLCGQALRKSIEVDFEDMKDITQFVPIEDFGEMLSEC